MQIQIPFSEFKFSYVRSRGPGGQNVNKTNSAAILRWNLLTSIAFESSLKEKLKQKLALRLTEDGDIIIRSETHRDQNQNRAECIKKLHKIIHGALIVPKKRIPTRPTKSAQTKRLDSKKKTSVSKILRRKVISDE